MSSNNETSMRIDSNILNVQMDEVNSKRVLFPPTSREDNYKNAKNYSSYLQGLQWMTDRIKQRQTFLTNNQASVVDSPVSFSQHLNNVLTAGVFDDQKVKPDYGLGKSNEDSMESAMAKVFGNGNDNTCQTYYDEISSSPEVQLSSYYQGDLNKSDAQSIHLFNQKNDTQTKPPFSYITLIVSAMNSKSSRKITLSEIYSWITSNFAYYRKNTRRWQNSIRHALSFNDCFIKVPRPSGEAGKGSYWTIHPNAIDMFESGSSMRRNRKFIDENRSRSSLIVKTGCKTSLKESHKYSNVGEANSYPMNISPSDQDMSCFKLDSHHYHTNHSNDVQTMDELLFEQIRNGHVANANDSQEDCNKLSKVSWFEEDERIKNHSQVHGGKVALPSDEMSVNPIFSGDNISLSCDNNQNQFTSWTKDNTISSGYNNSSNNNHESYSSAHLPQPANQDNLTGSSSVYDRIDYGTPRSHDSISTSSYEMNHIYGNYRDLMYQKSRMLPCPPGSNEDGTFNQQNDLLNYSHNFCDFLLSENYN